MIICPNCQSEIEISAVCPECGEPLVNDADASETVVLSTAAIRARHQRQWQSAEIGENLVIYALMDGQRVPIQLDKDEAITLGRGEKEIDGPDVDLTPYGAHERGVSRQHVAIGIAGDIVEVQDLGSTNGSFLNGRQMTPNQWYILRNRDELRLGSFVLRFSFS